MQMDYRRLQQVMSQPSPSAQDVNTVLTDMKRKKEMQDCRLGREMKKMAILNPLQQARYIMYLKSLLKEAQISRAALGRGALYAPRPPGDSGFTARPLSGGD